jgi:hypothetical protein
MSDKHPRRSPHRPDQEPQAAAAGGVFLVRRPCVRHHWPGVLRVVGRQALHQRRSRPAWVASAKTTAPRAWPRASRRSAWSKSVTPTAPCRLVKPSTRPSAWPVTPPAWPMLPSWATQVPGVPASRPVWTRWSTSALKGKGAMGPQGGGDFDDVEIARAVVFMSNAAGAKFAEPQRAALPPPRLPRAGSQEVKIQRPPAFPVKSRSLTGFFYGGAWRSRGLRT